MTPVGTGSEAHWAPSSGVCVVDSLPPVYEALFAAWAVFWGQSTFAFRVMHRPSHPWGQVCAALLA